jgi:hypothetical protein
VQLLTSTRDAYTSINAVFARLSHVCPTGRGQGHFVLRLFYQMPVRFLGSFQSLALHLRLRNGTLWVGDGATCMPDPRTLSAIELHSSPSNTNGQYGTGMGPIYDDWGQGWYGTGPIPVNILNMCRMGPCPTILIPVEDGTHPIPVKVGLLPDGPHIDPPHPGQALDKPNPGQA